jgi:hypothetical protein
VAAAEEKRQLKKSAGFSTGAFLLEQFRMALL